jgi:urease accessory protein
MFADISQSEEKARGKSHRKPVRPRPSTAPGAIVLQRSFGAVDLVFGRAAGETRASRVLQRGTARIRFPNVARGQPPEAVLLNIAGGMAGGDRQDLSVALDAGATATMTTQAYERIYRSLGDNATISGRITLAAGARVNWLPQAVILFNGARLKREMHVDMSSTATLLAVESVIFGRTASGEVMEYGGLSDAWFIRREGRLVHLERFEIDGAVQPTLDMPIVLNGNRAMATLRYVASDAHERLSEMRQCLTESPILAAASAWNGMILARFVAADGFSLTRELARVLTAFGQSPLPRSWML